MRSTGALDTRQFVCVWRVGQQYKKYLPQFDVSSVPAIITNVRNPTSVDEGINMLHSLVAREMRPIRMQIHVYKRSKRQGVGGISPDGTWV